MKRFGLVATLSLVLMLAAATYLTVELIHRHQFSVMDREVQATIEDFARAVHFDIDDDDHLLIRDASDPRGRPPEVHPVHSEYWHERATTWYVVAHLPRKAPKLMIHPTFSVLVAQERRGILLRPFIQVSLAGSPLTSVPEALDARLIARGLSYRTFRRE